MSDDENARGEWFAYTPLGANQHLTPEQRELVRRHQDETQPEPIGDVRVLIHDTAPGQSEIRFGGPGGPDGADMLRVAIRELTEALRTFEN